MKQERQIMAIVQQQFKDISEPEAIKKYFDELYKAKDPILDEKRLRNYPQKWPLLKSEGV